MAGKAPPPATPKLFAAGVLHRIGAPVTANNLHNFGLWLANEQNSRSWATDSLNPLGVTSPSGGVHAFSSFANAIDVTAATLLDPAYRGVVHAFRTNAPTHTTAAAIVNSPWNGSSHYGGVSTFLAHQPLLSAPSNPASGGGLSWSGIANEVNRIGLAAVTGGASYGLVTHPPNPINVAKGAVSGVTSVGSFLADLTNPTHLHNVGVFLGGAALCGVGLLIFFSQTKTAHAATGLATKAV
ncbi:MAG: hypothetical protein ACYCU5_16410 [Actinomycetes bacterium]